MDCQRCGKGLAEWQCSVCKRVVCSNCFEKVDGVIFCLDCIPRKEKVTQTSKALKSAVIGLSIIFIAMVIINFMINLYAGKPLEHPVLQGIISAVKSAAWLMTIGIGFILFLLVLALVASSLSSRKTKNL